MREEIDGDAAKSRQWGYVIIWEFRVRPEMSQRFESAYGSAGTWAQFFAQDDGYIGTELTHDVRDPRRYVTLDFWVSRVAYERFREQHLAEYKAIDVQCEELTESELQVGSFEAV